MSISRQSHFIPVLPPAVSMKFLQTLESHLSLFRLLERYTVDLFTSHLSCVFILQVSTELCVQLPCFSPVKQAWPGSL